MKSYFIEDVFIFLCFMCCAKDVILCPFYFQKCAVFFTPEYNSIIVISEYSEIMNYFSICIHNTHIFTVNKSLRSYPTKDILYPIKCILVLIAE